MFQFLGQMHRCAPLTLHAKKAGCMCSNLKISKAHLHNLFLPLAFTKFFLICLSCGSRIVQLHKWYATMSRLVSDMFCSNLFKMSDQLAFAPHSMSFLSFLQVLLHGPFSVYEVCVSCWQDLGFNDFLHILPLDSAAYRSIVWLSDILYCQLADFR